MQKKPENKVYITGLRAIEEHLKQPIPQGEILYSGAGKRIEALLMTARGKGVAVSRHDRDALSRITGTEFHKGVALAVPKAFQVEGENLETLAASIQTESALVLLLDGITDPHNLGAIIRSAEQFSADCVVLPRRRGAEVNDTVARVSSGAVEYVRTVQTANITRAVDALKDQGFWVYGADAGGTAIAETDLRGRVAVVVGNEGAGLSRLVKSHCDAIVSIPTTGKIDSLNVSVAAGIIMYEVRRQQGS